jgi:hypothetical protein
MAWFPFWVRFLQAPVRKAIDSRIQQRRGGDCDLRHTPNAGLTLSPRRGATVLGAAAGRRQSEAAEHERLLKYRRQVRAGREAGDRSLKGAPAPAFARANGEIRRAAPTAVPIVVNFMAFSPVRSAVRTTDAAGWGNTPRSPFIRLPAASRSRDARDRARAALVPRPLLREAGGFRQRIVDVRLAMIAQPHGRRTSRSAGSPIISSAALGSSGTLSEKP